MRRRSVLLGGAAAALVGRSIPSLAQARRPTVPYVGLNNATASQSLPAFLEGMLSYGWRNTDNFTLVPVFGDGLVAGAPDLARQAVALNPDVIFTPQGIMALALRNATSTLPIVCSV